MQIKEAYNVILQEDNFSFEMVSMNGVEKLVLKLNSKKIFHVWYHHNNYPQINYRGSTFPDGLNNLKLNRHIKNLTLYQSTIIDQ